MQEVKLRGGEKRRGVGEEGRWEGGGEEKTRGGEEKTRGVGEEGWWGAGEEERKRGREVGKRRGGEEGRREGEVETVLDRDPVIIPFPVKISPFLDSRSR